MINPSGNFKDETFGKDHQDLVNQHNGVGASLGAGFLNSNPYMMRGGFMDNSFPLDTQNRMIGSSSNYIQQIKKASIHSFNTFLD